MDTIQLLIIVTLLIVLAEVSYLVVKLPRQSLGRRQSRPILVDTSVLIDGRIIAVATSGFIGDTLVIPRSVVGELQYLADNADHDKRARARYGLDVVKELQNMPHMVVEILQDGSKAEEGVDERLLNLAKKNGSAICTIDYNLNKVAAVEGITVLNVNELAKSLRMAYLPGEKMMLELVQKGQDAHQGVGYLPDGTMVVVEHAKQSIGKTIEVEFIRSLQTAAGKMMFAKPVNREQPVKPIAKPIGKKPRPVADQPEVKPEPAKQPPQPTPTPAKPAAFHSDRASRPQPRQKRREQPQRTAKQRPAQNKPRTSADREASLLELVNKQ